MPENRGPTPYGNTDEAERAAINTLRYLLDPRRIKDYLIVGSTTPNYDGYLEMVADNRAPIGTFAVQVKKLPSATSRPPRFPCPTSLIFYAETSTFVPVLLSNESHLQ